MAKLPLSRLRHISLIFAMCQPPHNPVVSHVSPSTTFPPTSAPLQSSYQIMSLQLPRNGNRSINLHPNISKKLHHSAFHFGVEVLKSPLFSPWRNSARAHTTRYESKMPKQPTRIPAAGSSIVVVRLSWLSLLLSVIFTSLIRPSLKLEVEFLSDPFEDGLRDPTEIPFRESTK